MSRTLHNRLNRVERALQGSRTAPEINLSSVSACPRPSSMAALMVSSDR
jgi:hypothetical protein